MSTVQVDTINESTTGSGVTVDGVLIKDGNVDGIDVSGITQGITEADQFRLNTSLTSSANPIGGSNFDRNDAISGMTGVKIGTGMSVNSTGHWTFPSTGIWLVTFKGTTSFSGYAGGYIYMYGTVNNGGAWTLIGNENSQGQTNYDRGHPQVNALLDIQDTSNYKIYFRWYDEGNATLQGSSSSSHTTFES